MKPELLLDKKVTLYCGDCLTVLDTLPENSVDACVTDPPYHLTSIVQRFGSPTAAPPKEYAEYAHKGANPYKRVSTGFMGKQWDGGDIAFNPETWRKVLRVLKPGGFLLSFGGTRTYHRMACAIEDAGFEIRDSIQWLYGSGFPKSLDISKAIDRAAGAEREVVGTRNLKKPNAQKLGQSFSDRSAAASGCFGPNSINDYPITNPATDAARQWSGFGTALKPACEMIVLARKPLSESTVAANCLRWGVGALNIDGARVGVDGGTKAVNHVKKPDGRLERWDEGSRGARNEIATLDAGRWPANVILSDDPEVQGAFPQSDIGGAPRAAQQTPGSIWGIGAERSSIPGGATYVDSGSAARFFYCAKGDADDRLGSKHPTIKPLDLMQYLVRLVTPPKGLVLDPFAGTGPTGEAAWREGMRAVLIEREKEYQGYIRRRLQVAKNDKVERKRMAKNPGSTPQETLF